MPIRVEMTIPLPAMEAAVEGLCAINMAIMRHLSRSGVPFPTSLYDTEVRYRQPGKLQWHTLADVYDLGWGDCKDLVAIRCAELRFEGEPATPYVYPTRRRGRWHAVVRRADGEIEDPSRIMIERNGR